MLKILSYNGIDRAAWSSLVLYSSTGNWFQTPEAYDFFASKPELFKPFAVAIASDLPSLQGGELPGLGSSNGRSSGERHSNQTSEGRPVLRAVCVGYITIEKSALKQMLTRRAIIVGGPAIADDCTDEEVIALMSVVRKELRAKAIYVECRNFNDYSRWKGAFASAGFEYVPHLNFHVNTSGVDIVDANLGKSRKRDIKTSIRDGAVVIEQPTIEQVREYYAILDNLYRTKVKTPLFPLSFFEALYTHPDGRFLLVGLPNAEGKTDIIGGTVCIEYAGKCVYEWFVCGRDGEWKSIFPSSVATYVGIKYAAEHNCPRFDMMGAGNPEEAYGVRDFKARFGGKEVEHGRFLCIAKPLLYKLGVLGVKLLKKLK